MTWLVMLISAVGAALLQNLLPGPAWLGHSKWPLLLGVVLYYALQRERSVMWLAALVAGTLQDALSAVPLGTSAVCFMVVGWVSSRFRSLVLSEALVTQSFFGMASALGVGVMLYVLAWRPSASAPALGSMLLAVAGLTIEAALCTPVVFHVVGGLDRRVGNIHAAKEVEGVDGDLDGFAE